MPSSRPVVFPSRRARAIGFSDARRVRLSSRLRISVTRLPITPPAVDPVSCSPTRFINVTRSSASVITTASPIERRVTANRRSRSRRTASISCRLSAISIAHRSSASLKGLSRYPNASLRFTRSSVSTSENALRYTGMSSSSLITWAASMPSIGPGIRMSIRTSSGDSARALRIASSPECAIPTTRYPSAARVRWMSLGVKHRREGERYGRWSCRPFERALFRSAQRVRLFGFV